MNLIILKTAFVAWCIAQISKFFLYSFRAKKWDWAVLIASGGMPSSHTALVSSITIKIGMIEGFHSSLFAIAAILACVVIYDAMNVRQAVGLQAKKINEMADVIEELTHQSVERVKIVSGHTLKEVIAGFIIGASCGLWV